MIHAKHLEKNYGLLTILHDVSFDIEKGNKIALVGKNGTGKTTILKVLIGLEEVDSGVLDIVQGTRIGYLPQDTALLSAEPKETITHYIERVTGEKLHPIKHEAEALLAGFGFESLSLDSYIAELSSGQKSKVALVAMLLQDLDLLLLDEPTNNLDIPALIWLEDYLKRSKLACVIVSHDRRFLDAVATKVFEIDADTRELHITKGTYSDYIENKKQQLTRQKLDYDAQQEEIDRLSKRVREKKQDALQGAKWEGPDNDKMARGFKRDMAANSDRVAKHIEKRIEHMEKIDKPVEHRALAIELDSEASHGTLEVSAVDLVVGYSAGDDVVTDENTTRATDTAFSLGPVSFEIRYGTRVGIMGLNGSGKSTLLKTITGERAALSGAVRIGSGLHVGNMMQEHESLPREATLLEFLMDKGGLSIRDAYNQLGKFGFEEKQAKKAIETLSPGGRARLLLALFSAKQVNMLVLDEPTNHLDIEALEALEETLDSYTGTVLLVSHDRYFLEKAKLDVVYVLEDGQLKKLDDYKVYVADAEKRAKGILRGF